MTVFNCSTISTYKNLFPVCGSSLSVFSLFCCGSCQLNGVFSRFVLCASLLMCFGQLKKSIDIDIPQWPLKGHSVCMLFHFLQSAPKGLKSLQTAVKEMREKRHLCCLQEIMQLLLIEHPDMRIKCLWHGYLMNNQKGETL